jgi:hypothetical protein
MKRYWLFAGFNGKDRAPGMYSFVHDFESTKGAIDYCDFDAKECDLDWGQVFDTKEKKLVYEGDYQRGWRVVNTGIKDIKQDI